MVEGDETVIATIAPDSAYAIGSPSTGTVTIIDQPVVTVAATVAAANETGLVPGKFTISRSGPVTAEMTVHFTVSGSATSGSDYNGIGTSVLIPEGSTSVDLTVGPVADAQVEGNETVVLTLEADSAYALGSPSSDTVTISDQPVVTLSTPVATAHETGLVPGKFTLTRSGPTTGPLTVALSLSGTATNGTDYATIASSAVIPSGEASVDLPVMPLADTLVEGDETVILTLATNSAYAIGTTATGTITLTDQPVLTVTTSVATASETGPVSGRFTVSRSGPTSSALAAYLTLGGTATNGADYPTIGTSVVIPSGSATADIIVTPSPDSLTEGDETVVLTLASDGSYAIGTASSGTITIADAPSALPIDAWRVETFGAQAGDPAVSGDNADPDHDEVPNLLEYALGANPLDGLTRMPGLKPATDPMTLHLDLPDPAPADLTYSVEGGDPEGNWSTLATMSANGTWIWTAAGSSHVTMGDPANGRRSVDVARPDSAANATKYFLRLKAARN